MAFIDEIAVYVQKYAPQYGIKVCSPIIAQALLESASGTSNKVVAINKEGKKEYRHNYFGLKWRNGRCAISNDYFEEWTYERENGKTVKILAKFCKFKSMEDCVIGYFQWTNIKNYANLKGVTDPKTYLENIKKDGYATDEKYVDKVMAVVEKYDLTKYDRKENNNMSLIISLDAGHGLTTLGKRCSKKLDPNETREWWLNNRIADRLEILLANYDCKVVRVDDTTGAKDVSLSSRTKMANNAKADVYISIHHNAGANNGNAGGTEVYYYSSKPERPKQATALYNSLIKHTGLKGNRATPVRKHAYYVVKETNMPAFLIENGYMDSKIDTPIILTPEHAEKTAQAILCFLIEQFGLKSVSVTSEKDKTQNSSSKQNTIYRVQVGAYGVKANAEAMQKKLKTLGFDAIIVEK